MAGPLYTLGAFKLARLAARFLSRESGQWLAPRIGARLSRRNPAGLAALRENLRVVTGLQGAALDDLCARNVAHFSGMLADYFFCAGRSAPEANGLLESWEGLEHLERAQAAGRGIVLVTGHLGHWELGGELLSVRGLPMTVITLEEPSTTLTAWREQYRRRVGIQTLTVGPGREFAIVEMMGVLRANGCLAMLVDRPYPGSGAPVAFFGRPSEFSTAPALLWHHTGAAVIPAFVLRQPNGRYRAIAGAPLPFTEEGGTRAALARNTQTVASAFESVIRDYPDQWFNYVPIWPTQSPAP
jgi:KDO2-lipid IV(A) lauroyltransferase